MNSSPRGRLLIVSCTITVVSPAIIWLLASYLWWLRPQVGVMFTMVACVSAGVDGWAPAIVEAVLDAAALNGFSALHQPPPSQFNDIFWSLLLAVLALTIGYARERWSAAEML